MKILQPLKRLPLGFYRLVIVGRIIIPIIFGIIVINPKDDSVFFAGTFFWCNNILYIGKIWYLDL